MRTTIRIDDELYRRVKADAARSGRTVGQLIEDAVRAALDRRVDVAEVVPDLPVYGGSGVLGGVDLSSGAALRDLMESDGSLEIEGGSALR